MLHVTTAAPAAVPPSAQPRASVPAETPRAVAQVASPAATEEAGTQNPLLHDAEQTVRTYIAALSAGDDSTAQAQLLANAGTPAAQLSEKEFLDNSARIVGMSASATSSTTASVDVDVHSAKGAYYAHYELRRLDSGVTLIREHNFTKT